MDGADIIVQFLGDLLLKVRDDEKPIVKLIKYFINTIIILLIIGVVIFVIWYLFEYLKNL